MEEEKEAHTDELLNKITSAIETSLEKSEQKLKKKKKKKEPKNPVSFTPVKKELNKYTVTGNVNSRGIKYKVVEIIEAQDETIANSIFKERAKRSLGGVRNVTKVKVEVYRDGDKASKEEIIEKLPKSEPVNSVTDKSFTHKEIVEFADKTFDNMDKIKRKTLEKLVKSEEVTLIKVSLKDKITNKSLLTAYKFLYIPRLNEISKKVDNVDSFYDLDSKSKSCLMSAIVKDEMSYITDVFDETKNSIVIYELDWREECFSNKEISNILKTIDGEITSIKMLANKLSIEAMKELGIDASILEKHFLSGGILND